MKKELTFVLNYALNKGFQIHPDAFKILEDIDVKKLEKIIKEIVRELYVFTNQLDMIKSGILLVSTCCRFWRD